MSELNNINEKKVKEINIMRKKNASELVKKKETKLGVSALQKIGLTFKQEETVTGVSLEIEQKFAEKKKELDSLLKEFQEGKTAKFSGIAYVTFMTEGERDDCLKNYELKTTSSKINRYRGKVVKEKMMKILGAEVVVELAPEPLDVYWEHQKDKTPQKLWKRVACRMVDLGVMSLLFWAIIELTRRQNSISVDIKGKSTQ